MSSFIKPLLAVMAIGSLLSTSAHAATPSNFFEGFETDVVSWSVFGAAFTPVRVSSGTDGILSSEGSFHAKLNAGSLATPTNAATNFGAYTNTFPTGGYVTSLDIYLDPAAITVNDSRFNYLAASSNSVGAHLRDFAFVIGGYTDADLTGPGAGTDRFIINGQNNSGRSSSFPKDLSKSPVAVTATGWYTFEHKFYDNGGSLAVDLNLYDPADSLVSSWTLNNPADLIPAIVGGNRYGWVSANELPLLAIDASSLSVVPEPATLGLAGLASLGLLAARRRRCVG